MLVTVPGLEHSQIGVGRDSSMRTMRPAGQKQSELPPIWRPNAHKPSSRDAVASEAGRSPEAAVAGRPEVLTARSVLALQRGAGNRAVVQLLQRSAATSRPVTSGPSWLHSWTHRSRTVEPHPGVPNVHVQRQEGPAPAAPATGSDRRPTLPLLSPSLWQAGNASDFFRTSPAFERWLLTPPELPSVRGLIDWGLLAQTFRNRQLALGSQEQDVILDHWERWYPAAQALYRLPLARTFFSSPASIMNSMTRKMVDSSLAGDHPDILERFNREGERFGMPSPTTVTIPVANF
jgi:hypothetical protein